MNITKGVVEKAELEGMPTGLVAFIELSPASPHFPESEKSSKSVREVDLSEAAFDEITTELSTELSRRLPSYMIPRYWLPLTRIPTQPSGKADRKALRSLFSSSRKSRRKGQAAATQQQLPDEPEEKPQDNFYRDVRAAWSKILRVPPESIRGSDHFTRLGGDSIGFIRVVSLLRRQGYPVTFPDLSGPDVSTLKACAERLRDVAREREGRSSTRQDDDYEPFSLVPNGDRQKVFVELEEEFGIRSEDAEDVFPTSPAQDALLAPSVDGSVYFAQAVYPIKGGVHHTALADALSKLVDREPMLRTAFVILEGSPKILQIRFKPSSEALRATKCKIFQVENLNTSVEVGCSRWTYKRDWI
jgi:acyl carrier protein